MRLPLLRAVVASSAPSSFVGAGAVTSSFRRPAAVAAEAMADRIARWWRRRRRRRRSLRPAAATTTQQPAARKKKKSSTSGKTNNNKKKKKVAGSSAAVSVSAAGAKSGTRKRRRAQLEEEEEQEEEDEEEEEEHPAQSKKRPKVDSSSRFTTASSVELSSTSTTAAAAAASAAASLLNILRSSPSASERREVARVLLLQLSAAGDDDHGEYAAVALKNELSRELLSLISDSKANDSWTEDRESSGFGGAGFGLLASAQQQPQLQQRVSELLAVWQDVLVVPPPSDSLSQSGTTPAEEEEEERSSSSSRVGRRAARQLLVGVCRRDWIALTRAALHFAATDQLAAAAACADWCRRVVLLQPPFDDDENEEVAADEFSKKLRSVASDVVNWRNRHWLWSAVDGGENHPQQLPDLDNGSGSTAAMAALSPLACLIGAHYTSKDADRTAGLRGADTLRSILDALVDPNHAVQRLEPRDRSSRLPGDKAIDSKAPLDGGARPPPDKEDRDGENQASQSSRPGFKDEDLESIDEEDDVEDEDDEKEEGYPRGEICAEEDDTVREDGDPPKPAEDSQPNNVDGEGGGEEEDEDEECCCECDEDDDDDDDDVRDMDEHYDVEDDEDEAMEIELSELEEVAVEEARAAAMAEVAASRRAAREQQKRHCGGPDGNGDTLIPTLPERQSLLVQASMQVLVAQYPYHVNSNTGHHRRHSFLTLPSETCLLEGINGIIKPPKKPLNTKIIMRRAPTQEEFFRGSLSRNPVSINQLQQSAAAETEIPDPTVADLRNHIARDLQMADSAELLEILVANKILDPSLKLRVVHQVLWRNHLMENSTSAGGSGMSSLVSHSGLAMIFSSGLPDRLISGSRSTGITADTPASLLPSMIATYRLAGIDGEATEDIVTTLDDPDCPATTATAEEREARLEKEYGLTRLVTKGRGIHALLRSIHHAIGDTLRRIRRDSCGRSGGGDNPSRRAFSRSSPPPALLLLRHCAQLASNRKLLLQARAPTVLLKMLLDVLKVLEAGVGDSNPTANILQELIEVLSSDISSSNADSSVSMTAEVEEDEYESDDGTDAASMPLLLLSIEKISLSLPLRRIIAKLLPFLTYGSKDLSKTLAQHFIRNIDVETLGAVCETDTGETSELLMSTFVETLQSLPPNPVCHSLRVELIHLGFIERLVRFIAKNMPNQPPPWSPALFSGKPATPSPGSGSKTKRTGRRGSSTLKAEDDGGNIKDLELAWYEYFARDGVRTAFKILSGLSKNHVPTQSRIATAEFVQKCHWLEATSEKGGEISTGGFPVLAETLLDDLAEGNEDVAKVVGAVRKKTRQRKKELAEERRAKALQRIGAFRPLATSNTASTAQSSSVRGAAASILAPVLGLFRDSGDTGKSEGSVEGSAAAAASTKKPTWLDEALEMEDEAGLTCSVCQEGRTLRASELLGLYAYVKKVSVPEQWGSRADIDGTNLLKALPPIIPETLVGDPVTEEWYIVGRAASENISSSSSSESGARKTTFTVTVSAGNAIHLSCHRSAARADRNNAKSPKSEWEGAFLRNSRVHCNVILPLLSSRSSKVPLTQVDVALSEHQAIVSNLLGSTPKSGPWIVLNDVRLLLLRMAYGESLSADCGGGSLVSNCQLVFHQLQLADLFDKDAQVDQPYRSQHARALPRGFLAACAIVAVKGDTGMGKIVRGVADAAPMAALNTIVFHNAAETSGGTGSSEFGPTGQKPLWIVARDYFLRGLLICGGRRHALGIEGSGCQSARRRMRSSSFSAWDGAESDEDAGRSAGAAFGGARGIPSRGGARTATGRRGQQTRLSVEDFQHALRPMITLYAIMDKLSAEYSPTMDDVEIEESAERLAAVIEECDKAKNIHELLATAGVHFAQEEMIDLLQKGMVAA